MDVFSALYLAFNGILQFLRLVGFRQKWLTLLLVEHLEGENLNECSWWGMNCGLTLDLDDISIEDSEVIELMNWLSEEFGSESVWYRKSFG